MHSNYRSAFPCDLKKNAQLLGLPLHPSARGHSEMEGNLFLKAVTGHLVGGPGVTSTLATWKQPTDVLDFSSCILVANLL